MGPACQRKRTQVFSTKIESESTLKWRLWREFFHAMDWPDWPVTQQIMVIWSRCLRCTTWGRSMIPIIPYSTHDTQEAPPNRMKWQFNTLWHEGWPQNENGVKKYSGILIVLTRQNFDILQHAAILTSVDLQPLSPPLVLPLHSQPSGLGRSGGSPHGQDQTPEAPRKRYRRDQDPPVSPVSEKTWLGPGKSPLNIPRPSKS